MNRKHIFIANWKMNLTVDEELKFASSYYDKLSELSNKDNNSIILCPSFISLYPLTEIFKNTEIFIGAQDCCPYNKGSFTGQVPAESLNYIGCNYCIIGHSERKKFNKETDEQIAQKFSQLTDHHISPILCIGETLEDHQNKKTIHVLKEQLEKIFKIVRNDPKISDDFEIIIAYEPVWSIGTGEIPPTDCLETVFTWIKKETMAASSSINWKIVYGGSVSSKNIQKLKDINNFDGFLIGKASLDFQEFEKIVQS